MESQTNDYQYVIKLEITKEQARKFILIHQGIWSKPEFKGKKGIMDFINRVGCIQYDSLNIAGRNPELVLQARIPGYRSTMLDELLYKERKLLDGLDKVMSIYPVEDWPYFARRRKEALKWYGQSNKPILPYLEHIREEIDKRGPISSLDLDLNEVVDWAWASTRLSRAALESMYLWGELIVHHKVNTRKIYDFTKKHIPESILEQEDPNTTKELFYQWYALRRIRAVGMLWNKAGDAWIGISELKAKERSEAFEELLKQNRIIEVQVENMNYPFYMAEEDLPRMKAVLEANKSSKASHILAPLDNMLWDRKLVKELFDFDYRWEVYKPLEQRDYGYYVLPVLYGDRFVARFEPGRDKKTNTFVIKNWWWEPGVKKTEKLKSSLKQCFEEFLSYLGDEKIKINEEVMDREEFGWLIE